MDKHICKAKRVDTGEWVYGYYVCVPHKYGHEMAHLIIEEGCEYDGSGEFWYMDVYEVDPNTVCRCTGVLDKDGKMLFEHDIVCTKYGRICEVVWFESPNYVGWDLYPTENIDKPAPDNFDLWNSENLELISNKFDNTELMEE